RTDALEAFADSGNSNALRLGLRPQTRFEDAWRFVVPMSGSSAERALHEPERRAPTRCGEACRERADLEIGAPSSPFMVPMPGIKVAMATHEPTWEASTVRGLWAGERDCTYWPVFGAVVVRFAPLFVHTS